MEEIVELHNVDKILTNLSREELAEVTDYLVREREINAGL